MRLSRRRLGMFFGAVSVVALVSIASAGEGICSFTLAGYVKGVRCMMGPAPNQCYMEVRVPAPQTTEIGVWCRNELADVCSSLERGMPVIVLGEDDGESKTVSHVAIWLKPVKAPAEDRH